MMKRLLKLFKLLVTISPLIYVIKAMFGAYTTPRTWVVGEIVTAALLNTHLRDNMTALKAPPTGLYNVNEATDYTTTSTAFVDVDSTDLALTITTTGGDIMVGFVGSIAYEGTATNLVYFEILLDGVAQAGNDGVVGVQSEDADSTVCVSFVFLIQSASAASHTVKLQWKVQSGASTATMYAGAATANRDLHPQFWAREVS